MKNGIIISIAVIMIVAIMLLTLGKIEKSETKINGSNIKNYSLQSNETVKWETDTAGVQVPVPIGYVGSKATGENTVNTGYVIYEGEDEVNNTNVAEAHKTRNQYVWIPVPDVHALYGTDINGKIWGKGYDISASGKEIATPMNWKENNGIMEFGGGYIMRSGHREPSVKSDTAIFSDGTSYTEDTNSGLKTFKVEADEEHELLNQMEKDFYKMIKTVEKYGGFYVGRYETAELSKNKVVVQKGKTGATSQEWYKLYNKCKDLNGSNNNVKTGMIWGCQYDRVLMWLIESGNKTGKQVAEDSISWGNYQNNAITYTNTSGVEVSTVVGGNTVIPTGSSEYTKANNIYDLAGNVGEWTMEGWDLSSSRTIRGGLAGWLSTDGAASDRTTLGPTSYGWMSTRVVLYIN